MRYVCALRFLPALVVLGAAMLAWRRNVFTASVVLAVFLGAREGAAQTKRGPAITKSDFGLDLFQGPVTTASRVIGLAGAYTSLAEWCEGEYSNAASPAVRAPYSLRLWDYDLCLGFTNPGAFAGTDFENRGASYSSLPTRFSNSVTYNFGLQVQYASMGVTVVYDQLRLSLEETSRSQSQIGQVIINRVTGSIANAFLNGQLVIGGGFRAAAFSLDEQIANVSDPLLSHGGAGSQIGVIVKPKNTQFRVGATVRSEITASNVHGTSQLSDGSQVIGGKILPSHIVVPWEVEVGAAMELGRHPLNPPRVDVQYAEDAIRAQYDQKRLERAAAYDRAIAAAPEKNRERVRRGFELEELAIESREDGEIREALRTIERAQAAQARLWDRQQVLLLASLLITGATPDSVGITDFLTQERTLSGQKTVLSARIGFETEVVRNWVLVRGGAYLEPARYDDVNARAHVTSGIDVRLFRFNPFGLLGDDPWRIRLATDLAPRYFNFAFALGKYH